MKDIGWVNAANLITPFGYGHLFLRNHRCVAFRSSANRFATALLSTFIYTEDRPLQRLPF
jgi:hypothetical protein